MSKFPAVWVHQCGLIIAEYIYIYIYIEQGGMEVSTGIEADY